MIRTHADTNTKITSRIIIAYNNADISLAGIVSVKEM